MSALSMPTRLDVDLLAARVALADGALEALEHVGAEELLERRLVALGKRHDDRLIGHLGAVEELRRDRSPDRRASKLVSDWPSGLSFVA